MHCIHLSNGQKRTYIFGVSHFAVDSLHKNRSSMGVSKSDKEWNGEWNVVEDFCVRLQGLGLFFFLGG